jgi:hypothetical protein
MKRGTKCLMAAAFAILVGFLVLGGLSAPLPAQQVYGSINGVMTDASGGAVPNATVTATNEGTNAAMSGKTDGGGAYVISNLQPGVYDISSTVEGFAAFSQTGIHVEVGLSTTSDIALALAGQQASVTVVASETPVVNTEQSVFGTNLDQNALTNLPVNTRRWSKLRDPYPRRSP